MGTWLVSDAEGASANAGSFTTEERTASVGLHQGWEAQTYDHLMEDPKTASAPTGC
jgi:hypothetical protein